MSLNELISNQTAAADIIQRSITNYKKTAIAKRTKGFVTERLADVKKLWLEYTKNHFNILQLAQNLKQEEREKYNYLAKDEYFELEIKYFEFIGLLRDTLIEFDAPLSPSVQESLANSTAIAAEQSSSYLKLPRISLPKFSGSYESWRSFHDLFKSLVHQNPSLPPVQKLHYLKASVSGEAEHLLRQFPITDANYENAWKVLLERYDNKRVLVHSQLKILCNLPKCTTESSKAIKGLIDKASECIYELNALDVTTDNWDPFLIYMLVQCLPTETRRMWEHEVSKSNQLPSFKELKEFLEQRFRTLEAITETKTASATVKGKALTHFTSSGEKCSLCKDSHRLFRCPKFMKLSTDGKYKVVSTNNLCVNCLSKGHKLQFCNSKFTCRKCGRKHHSLLHRSKNLFTKDCSNSLKQTNASQGANNSPQKVSPPSSSTSKDNADALVKAFHTNRGQRTVQALLSTALVNVYSKSGTICTLRALIDSGSQVSFITQAAARKLQLRTTKTSIQITGLGKSEATNVQSQTLLEIHPHLLKHKSIKISALIVDTITDLLPPSTIPIEEWHHIKDLHLADPYFNRPGKIDLLLGADAYSEIILEGLRKGPPGTPTAQYSTLGWILFGSFGSKSSFSKASSLTIHVKHENENTLDKLLQKFWEAEETYVTFKHSKEDQECENFYKNTHTRKLGGRYEVRLPFKGEKPDLGDSRNMALRRFHSLEKKFERNPEFQKQYSKCIDEYLTLGHMKEVDRKFNNCYYMPHHAVLKESTTTKLRVVFDASAKTTNGKNLNEQIHKGPVLQSDLFTILLRWRKYKFAMSADIEKMYRMIDVHSNDHDFQRILWRKNPQEHIKDYALTTVTFGTTPAPYLAIRTLHQLAADEAAKYPIASKIVTRDFYVDDLMTGADSVEEALATQHELLCLLSSGGFNLRKWVSNSSDLLANIPDSHREVQLPLTLASDDSVKTLGVLWHPGADFFTLQYRHTTERPTTKRSVLSDIATLFDPLGWISPIVVSAKILMQAIWLSGCSWDDPIPDVIRTQWQNLKSELHFIEKIQIPRWLHTTSNLKNCQLHGFSDASILAYSAVIYLRVLDREQQVHVNLVIAKSKVAPTKPMTLPRLELCGALLLARLIKRVQEDLDCAQIPVFAWTDSSIVLSWIKNHPNKFKTFIANRISEIQDLVRVECWRHVKSADNPADCNSRGVKPLQLIKNELWWQGPNWLRKSENTWPESKFDVNPNTELELKRLTCTSTREFSSTELLSKFSSFSKLQRVLAYCLRFISNSRNLNKNRSSGYLTTNELTSARNVLVKLAQQQFYHAEIKCLKAGINLPKKSILLPLCPFLDNHGIIRVGGRLKNSKISYSQQHPVLLPRDSPLTTLIIRYFHIKTLHGGATLVLSSLRNEYWIPQGRKTVKQHIHKCITCFRHSSQTKNQIMGDLPAPRVNIARPFQHTGIDYAGPIQLRMSKHRGNRSYKGYICIFVCLATKAIHIEPVSDLSTAGFIAAFKRFISRRGLCTDVYSDCGSNFIGANKELSKEYMSAIKQANDTLAEEIAHEGIQWHFNPPSAPHFGGLWEAGVKSIKFHLKRVLGNSILTYEEFATVLAQIEACLNSRPLCPSSEDPDDLEILTPGHFLIGNSLIAPPEPQNFKNIPSLSRWNYLQYLRQHFWKKWSTDYLNSLQNRPKWYKHLKNPKVGDMAIIKDNNLPPSRWLLGRIVEIFPGSDKAVRVVSIKTQNTILKRPLNKICILPIHD